MKYLLRLTFAGALFVSLSACGGSKDITCDEVQYYQLAEPTKRVVAPEGMSELDPLREIGVPEASPRDPKPAGSPCFDRPPEIKLSS